MPVDVGNEINRVLDNEKYKSFFRALSNPIVMATMTTLIIIIAIIFIGIDSWIKTTLYIGLITFMMFMFHDTLVLREVNKEKIDPSLIHEATLGNVESRYDLAPHTFGSREMFRAPSVVSRRNDPIITNPHPYLPPTRGNLEVFNAVQPNPPMFTQPVQNYSTQPQNTYGAAQQTSAQVEYI
jgi:hypothetical protein